MLLCAASICCMTVLAQHSLYSLKLSYALQNETLLEKMKHSKRKQIPTCSNAVTEKMLLEIFLLCSKSNVVYMNDLWLIT